MLFFNYMNYFLYIFIKWERLLQHKNMKIFLSSDGAESSSGTVRNTVSECSKSILHVHDVFYHVKRNLKLN